MNHENVLKELKTGYKTIPQLCKSLNIDDEFEVISTIGDLEASGKVCLKGWDKFYNPDGCIGFLAKYGLI
jgi:hypothetical protein